MEEVNCDICGFNQNEIYLDLQDRFTGEWFKLTKCVCCSHIYLNPRPSKKKLRQYYPESYEQHQVLHQSEKLVNRPEFHAANILVDFIEKFRAQRGRLLDVGCATGIFLKAAELRGWHGTGIELVETAAQIAREQFQLNVHVGVLEEIDLPKKSFEVITFWDVLEHLPSPSQAMEKCYELLVPGGLVVFTTPNLASFDRYIFGKYWIGWEVPRHLHLFTPYSVARLIAKSGFCYVDDRCVLGGKGTFILSAITWLQAHGKSDYLFRKLYPIVSAILWPYRRVSYLLKRGPIVTFVVQKRA